MLDFNKDKLHPTQKPAALPEYFIKTYTSEGDVALDNCMGSTGVAALKNNRKFIGIEKDENYFNIAKGGEFLMKLNELIDALIEVRDNYGGDVECAISLNGELTCVSAFVDDLDYAKGEVTLYGETNEL